MKNIFKNMTVQLLIFCNILLFSCQNTESNMTTDILRDKIKGGWAGQTIGVIYGAPTEFKYNGVMISDSIPISWDNGACKWYFDHNGGIYDDIYMDLTFVNVFDKYGFDVHVDSLAHAFAYAGYKLWHANQAARYNILNGMGAPESGYWKNNPHADDIDFQIEADFAGIMSPGMPNTASEICDKVGHIICYGDGWYGGVYVASLYSLAFLYDDMNYIVEEALKVIPQESNYYKCMRDVIDWCKMYNDWKVTWQKIEDKWADEINCTIGTKDPFNIDAKVNSAYVVMGLLYGNKDIGKTVDVATRCGADSDCNPATAAGILCTMLGYSNIPDKWLDNVREVEDLNFDHTEISLNKVYQMSYNHALEMIRLNGGYVNGNDIFIKEQQPIPVKLEQSFENLDLVDKYPVISCNLSETYEYPFKGAGIALKGKIKSKKDCPENYVAQVEISVDGKTELVNMPADFTTRKVDIYWNYDLPQGEHLLTMKWLNPIKEADIVLEHVLVYSQK